MVECDHEDGGGWIVRMVEGGGKYTDHVIHIILCTWYRIYVILRK